MRITRQTLLFIFLITLSYLLVLAYARNIVIINETIFEQSPIQYKLQLFFALTIGLWTTMGAVGFITMVITGMLIGINFAVVRSRMKQIKQSGKVRIVAGGSSLLSIAGGGCASCGLPVLSLLGLSGSVAFLPFKGAELPYISIIMLSGSLFYLLKQKSTQACALPLASKQDSLE